MTAPSTPLRAAHRSRTHTNTNAKTQRCRRSNITLRKAIQRHCVEPEHVELDVSRLQRSRYLKYYKRPIGLLTATLTIVLLVPLLLLIAAAIKLDSPGPVVFRQERTGYLGRRFKLLKFRTMVVNAEQQKEQLRHLNVHGTESPDFKLREDPRVTRVGRLLRRASLDELPNLINVVRGEMAMVGPRPTSFPATTYAPHQLARLAICPGITGLWQISGRSDLDFCTRTELDIEYINNASWWLDLRILLVTPFRANKGAY